MPAILWGKRNCTWLYMWRYFLMVGIFCAISSSNIIFLLTNSSLKSRLLHALKPITSIFLKTVSNIVCRIWLACINACTVYAPYKFYPVQPWITSTISELNLWWSNAIFTCQVKFIRLPTPLVVVDSVYNAC